MGNSSSKSGGGGGRDGAPLFQRTDTSGSTKSGRSIMSRRSNRDSVYSNDGSSFKTLNLDSPVLSRKSSSKSVSNMAQQQDPSVDNSYDLHEYTGYSGTYNKSQTDLPPSMIQIPPKEPILMRKSTAGDYNGLTLNANTLSVPGGNYGLSNSYTTTPITPTNASFKSGGSGFPMNSGSPVDGASGPSSPMLSRVSTNRSDLDAMSMHSGTIDEQFLHLNLNGQDPEAGIAWPGNMVPGNGSIPGSAVGSVPGSSAASIAGSVSGSMHGSTPGSVTGSTPGSMPGSTPGSLRAGSFTDGVLGTGSAAGLGTGAAAAASVGSVIGPDGTVTAVADGSDIGADGSAASRRREINIEDLIQRLLDAGYSGKRTKNVCLKNSEIATICITLREIFLSQPPLLELSPPVKIVGDVHGQFHDLIRIFTKCGFPPLSNYLFLGDYVDRGKQSLETILLLLCYKIKYPENFFLLRGNHECASVTRVYGFLDECKRRCNTKTWRTFIDTFNTLPILLIVASKIFCVHGGLSPVLSSMDEIRRIQRPTDIPDYGLLNDLVWSDPADTVNEWEDNERGVSYCFNKIAINKFLNKFQFDLVVRLHMVVEDGYEFFNEQSLVTVFSAPNYCGEFDNWGAVMSVNDELLCSFELLDPLDSTALKQVMKKGRIERSMYM